MKKKILKVSLAFAVIISSMLVSKIDGYCYFRDEVNGMIFYSDINDYIRESRQRLEAKGYHFADSLPADATKAVEQKKVCAHEYENEVTKEPTCKDPGEMLFTCSLCGKKYTEEISHTDDHAYKDEITTKETCASDGLKTYTCEVCGDSYTEVIKALGHEYKESVTKEATCILDGTLTYKCDRCGDSYTEVIKALGHDDGSKIVVKEAGTFTKGLEETHCNRCDALIESKQIPSLYPIEYLYITTGVILCLAVLIGVVLIRKKHEI